ncbi:MAG TPA: SCO family protein [Solirubrobacteraceae bacterium]|nr:SCO family protein [Solirubrobacteraceae bacterium]
MLHPRVRLALMTFGTIALLAIAGFVIFSDPNSGASAPAVTDGFAGSIRPVAPAADFTLADQDGRATRVADLRGRPVVVTFMYTTCENDCPTMTQQIRGALDDLGRDVPVLAVSVDPANDTPARARAFIARQQMTGRMRFLLGDTAQLQRVWRTFGIQPQERGIEHSASVVLLDPTGVARVSFPVDQLTPEGVTHDLRALERPQS